MTGLIINAVLIVLLILIAVILIVRFTKKDYSEPDEIGANLYEINNLVAGVKRAFEDTLNRNVSDLNLNKAETLKREKNKSLIRQSLRFCGYGDLKAKNYVKDYIKDILQKKFSVDETTIDQIIPFGNEEALNIHDKFEILLYKYKKMYNYNALKELIIKYKLADIKRDGQEEFYEISESDIANIYKEERGKLEYLDKLEIVTQRVYQLYKGFGAIDEIRDMKIDGVSGGVSGVAFDFYNYDMEWFSGTKKENLNSFNSIWIFFQGKTIRLSFLGFGSQKELVRVCKNIYRYGNPGQLSEARGYIANEMKDGSRVVTFRPPFSASWAFFVRKFDSIEKKDIGSLLPDKGNNIVITTLNGITKGKMVNIITGEQGSGKTTLLLALIEFLSKTCNLRVYELIFELFIPKLYPEMNLLNLRETDNIYGQEALDILKKTDGTTTILGEVASHQPANWLIEAAQVNQSGTMATNHAVTTDDLIDYFVNSKLTAGYHDEKRAEQQVARALNFDTHMANKKGHRYVERITEIIPVNDSEYPKELNKAFREFFRRMTNYRTYKTVDIIRFENGEYVVKNQLSERAKERILNNLSGQERDEFENLFSSFIGGAAYEQC